MRLVRCHLLCWIFLVGFTEIESARSDLSISDSIPDNGGDSVHESNIYNSDNAQEHESDDDSIDFNANRAAGHRANSRVRNAHDLAPIHLRRPQNFGSQSNNIICFCRCVRGGPTFVCKTCQIALHVQCFAHVVNQGDYVCKPCRTNANHTCATDVVCFKRRVSSAGDYHVANEKTVRFLFLFLFNACTYDFLKFECRNLKYSD